MAQTNGLGFGGVNSFEALSPGRTEHVHLVRPLSKLLEFRRRTIDDIVNSPVVKNEISGYWKMQKQMDRRLQIGELERQWNDVRL